MAAVAARIVQLTPEVTSRQQPTPAGDVEPTPAGDVAPVVSEPVTEHVSSSSQATVDASADAAAEPAVAGNTASSSSATGVSASGASAPGPSGLAAAALADGSEIVFGVPIEDNGMAKVMRRVIVLAAVCATFYITHFIGNLMRGAYSSPSSGDSSSLWTAISSLLIELSIPACGYYGALHSNRQLTCCFCSCNLFVTIVSIMSFIRLNIRIGEIDGACERERNSHQRRTCEVWTSDGAEKYLMLFSTILVMCLGCLAFWFGNSLYQRLAQEFTSAGVSHVTLVGEVISLSSLPTVMGANPGATGPSSAVAVIPLDTAGGLPSPPSFEASLTEDQTPDRTPAQPSMDESVEPPQPTVIPATPLGASADSRANDAMPGDGAGRPGESDQEQL